MSITKIADLVAAIPYGNDGRKRYVNVGSLLKSNDNDPGRGPGFIVSLDAHLNPAGLPSREGKVYLSCYHPKERAAPAPDTFKAPPPPAPFDGNEDDIPF